MTRGVRPLLHGHLRDLRQADVNILTLGQYLRPTPKHASVDRYVEPARFDAFANEGRAMGFAFVASGPLPFAPLNSSLQVNTHVGAYFTCRSGRESVSPTSAAEGWTLAGGCTAFIGPVVED